jgi:Phage P22-like portal protein
MINSSSDPLERHPETLPEAQIEKMEDDRIKALQESGIDEEKVLHELHKNKGHWEKYWSDNRTRGKDDMDFLIRDQWTSVERGEFKRLFKTGLYFNKLYDVFRKIIGEQRNNTPNLKVRSLTGKATEDRLNLLTDLVKNISYQSRNDIVYQTAFSYALGGGYGAFRIDTEYEQRVGPNAFRQVIRYHRVNDANRCFWDARATESHKGDGNYCGYDTVLSKEEYEATYPNVPNPISFVDNDQLIKLAWERSKDSITVCDYYVKEWEQKNIYLLSNKESITKEEYEDLQDLHAKATAHVGDKHAEKLIPPLPEIVDKRITQDYKIMHYRCTQNKILEFTEWPSKILPVIFTDGDSYYLDGQQYCRSLIYYAKDAQRFLNYVGNEITTQFKNMQSSQWLGTPSNIEGNEYQWRNPELQQGILLANPDQKTFQMPTKLPVSEIPQSLLLHYQRATQDLKEIIGFYDAQSQGPEQSGVAVNSRAIQGSSTAFVFFDNLNRAIEQGARCVLDLLPSIMDTERTMNIMRGDGKIHSITLNREMPDGTYENKMEKGDYDIEIEAGPSFAVQKAQALDLFIKMVQVNPQIFPLVADKIAKNLDLDDGPIIEERFKTLVPPEILAKEAGQPPPPPKPNPQAQMMQMQQQLAVADLKEREHEIQVREAKLSLEQEKMQLEKARMGLELHKSQIESQNETLKQQIEIHKAELKHVSEMSKTIADMHKHASSNQHQKQV